MDADRRATVIRNALKFYPRGRKPDHDAAWKALDELLAENERLREALRPVRPMEGDAV